MSDLPQYSRIPNSETGERDSLVKAGRSSLDAPVPSYPPRAGASSTTTYNNVTYTFAPRYPVKGTTQNVLGILGRDREETVDIVRRAFPQLQDYADERLEFEVGVEGQNAQQWSRLMDEAWAQFATQPPTRMKVQVADAPGDARRRNMRDVGLVLLGPMLFFIFLATFVTFATLYDD